jgi:hypothetical protein
MFKLSPSSRHLLIFIGIFILAKVLISFAFQQSLLLFFPLEQLPKIMGSQEAALQSVALFFALLASSLLEMSWPELRERWAHKIRWPWGTEEVWARMSSASFYGFLMACSVVAVSVFFGFVKIETPSFPSKESFSIFPALLGQALYFIVWIVLIERSRQHVLPLLFQVLSPSWALLVYAGFESQLFFSFYEGLSSPAAISPVNVIFCIFVSLALSLSYLRMKRVFPMRRYQIFERVAFLCGLWFSFIHIFGQNISEWRAASLMQILTGPLNIDQSYLYLALLVLVTNTMLQSLLKEKALKA